MSCFSDYSNPRKRRGDGRWGREKKLNVMVTETTDEDISKILSSKWIAQGRAHSLTHSHTQNTCAHTHTHKMNDVVLSIYTYMRGSRTSYARRNAFVE